MFDNLAVVQIFNKHSSKEKTHMKLVRRLVLATLKWNIHFLAKHIPGKHNITTGRLSRFKSIFLLAFSAFLRLGEIVVKSKIECNSQIHSVVKLYIITPLRPLKVQ